MVGTSCRLDVLELLEKRVASRMSCRRELILQPQGTDNATATPAGLLEVHVWLCRAHMCLTLWVTAPAACMLL